MSRGTTSKRDPILGSVEDYWSPRAQIIRFLRRQDEPVSSFDVAEALDLDGTRNIVSQLLNRLVRYGIVKRTKLDYAAMKARGLTIMMVGAPYEYELIRGADATSHSRTKPAPYRCSKCGQPGHRAALHKPARNWSQRDSRKRGFARTERILAEMKRAA